MSRDEIDLEASAEAALDVWFRAQVARTGMSPMLEPVVKGAFKIGYLTCAIERGAVQPEKDCGT